MCTFVASTRPGTGPLLDVQPDLFGGVLLIRAWGRIGAFGRVVAEHYHSDTLATDAMQRHAERKKRRVYVIAAAIVAD
jgi:predicted DNA-binding WGR domain protein